MNRYIIYRDSRLEWRWRYVAANNYIIGVSSEGYINKQDCLHSIELMKASGTAPVYEQ